MSVIQKSLALVILLLGAMPADANWWRSNRTSAYYYYRPAAVAYPAPVAAAPVYPSVPYSPAVAVAPQVAVPTPIPTPTPYCPPAATPVPTAPIYAPATPAPPSEIPSTQKAPEVQESRFLSLTANAANSGLCTITFWNWSGRDQTLRIDGQTRLLPSGKGLTLDLPRQFVWQVGSQQARVERIGARETVREFAIQR
jgi:hypothetical protein